MSPEQTPSDKNHLLRQLILLAVKQEQGNHGKHGKSLSVHCDQELAVELRHTITKAHKFYLDNI